ncbi:MAG: hypothetical protein P4M15_03125 [Alphaproteobacteria bacterium]|nr:hypothetical protein [Alphaproteobacteria bacterium]
MEQIIRTGVIKAQLCDVFQEQLNYFFVGRPAYKARHDDDEGAFWELPVCFVFQFDVTNSKRIYPFDTGAFEREKFPQFIQMMDREDFEIGAVINGPEKYIGTFFGTPSKYFKMEPIDESKLQSRYSLGVFDAEIQALHRLVIRPGPKIGDTRVDDRRSTIEVQFDKDRVLLKKDLLAVIMPEPYFLEPEVTKYFESLGADIISYQTFPQNPTLYYAVIYEKIGEFFRAKKLI